ncbi:hypothetical protein AXI76_gp030 [Pseudoalteromonas phage H101]|uniref:Uncharacterized protein n=1 Tax=Pseudoalteromonas phage H101 TaxID=1654919 RepID=A0A0H4ISU8_9CAUD|nr:hypothetical protein AXI76_gp030 [Pseudoalteromonas phage H101]AKO60931.1 hypothetical protein [Pseudoalteromonas phage H101]
MITLDKQFGTFYDIFMKAKDITAQLEEEVVFEFNGVSFVTVVYSDLLTPDQVQSHIKRSQGKKVYL